MSEPTNDPWEGRDAYEQVNFELKAGIQRCIDLGKAKLIEHGMSAPEAEERATMITAGLMNELCFANWLGPKP
jgi:hypothetical protein